MNLERAKLAYAFIPTFCTNLYYFSLTYCWKFIDAYPSKQEQSVSDSQVVGYKLGY